MHAQLVNTLILKLDNVLDVVVLVLFVLLLQIALHVMLVTIWMELVVYNVFLIAMSVLALTNVVIVH